LFFCYLPLLAVRQGQKEVKASTCVEKDKELETNVAKYMEPSIAHQTVPGE